MYFNTTLDLPIQNRSMSVSSFYDHIAHIVVSILLLLLSTTGIASELLSSMKIQVNHFEVMGDNPLSAKETNELLANYLGEHQGIEGIEAAASELESALAQAGFQFFRVLVPSQPLTTSIIQLEVVSFPIGKIEVTGNEHFSTQNILNAVPTLKQGASTADLQMVNRGLDLTNRNRAKRTTLTFTNDEEKEQLNATLQVKDYNPMAVSVFVRNTGDETTGEYRSGIKFQHDNLFNRDHGLTLRYTVSPTEASDVDQYGVNYRIPLYSIADEFNLSAWKYNSNSTSVTDSYDLRGAGHIYRAQFTHFLTKSNDYQHQVDISLQDRLFNSDVTLATTSSHSDVRSRPVEIKYQGLFSTQNTDTDFFLGYRKNLSGGTNNDQSAYELSRSGAEQNWSAVIAGVHIDYWLPEQWLVRANVEGQFTNNTLVSAEQFGFGGSTALLGFAEGEVAGDQGYQAKLELMTPRLYRNAQLFGSYETGRVKQRTTLVNQAESEIASSIGLGITSALGKKCAAKLQAGYVLDGVDDESEGDDRTRDGDTKAYFDFTCRLL